MGFHLRGFQFCVLIRPQYNLSRSTLGASINIKWLILPFSEILPSLAKWNSFLKIQMIFVALISFKNISSELLAKIFNHLTEKYFKSRDRMILWNWVDLTSLQVIKVIAQIPEHTFLCTSTKILLKSHSRSQRWWPWPLEIFFNCLFIYITFPALQVHGKMVRSGMWVDSHISSLFVFFCCACLLENIYVFSL